MTQANEFGRRLDKIFEDGDPTKALIIDAFMKTNPTALNKFNLVDLAIVRRSSLVNDKKLDSEEYYNLMQGYRIADPLNQDLVIKKFEEVKEWTRQNYA